MSPISEPSESFSHLRLSCGVRNTSCKASDSVRCSAPLVETQIPRPALTMVFAVSYFSLKSCVDENRRIFWTTASEIERASGT